VPSRQRWTFFTTRIINNDLMKEKQGLINNNYSAPGKFMSYFMWPYEHDTSSHARIQSKIVCAYFYTF
jgi:hypothetical protein